MMSNVDSSLLNATLGFSQAIQLYSFDTLKTP